MPANHFFAESQHVVLAVHIKKASVLPPTLPLMILDDVLRSLLLDGSLLFLVLIIKTLDSLIDEVLDLLFRDKHVKVLLRRSWCRRWLVAEVKWWWGPLALGLLGLVLPDVLLELVDRFLGSRGCLLCLRLQLGKGGIGLPLLR